MSSTDSSDATMTSAPSAPECSICFENITDSTGYAVLSCAHRFHLMCVVRWFQEQDGPSSCPCCRHEVGTLDNVPVYPEDEEDEESVISTLTGWSDENSAEDDDDDANSVGSIRRLWVRDPNGGQWEGRWVLDHPVVTVWDPVAEPADVPEELDDIATQIQRIWRGHRVRRQGNRASAPPSSPAVGPIPTSAIATAEAEAALSLLKLSTSSRAWIMNRMMRVV